MAGLTAALELAQSSSHKHKYNIEIVILEARNLTVGRSHRHEISLPHLSTPTPSFVFDHGGQWVGPTQSHVLSILKKFNMTMYPSPHATSYSKLIITPTLSVTLPPTTPFCWDCLALPPQSTLPHLDSIIVFLVEMHHITAQTQRKNENDIEKEKENEDDVCKEIRELIRVMNVLGTLVENENEDEQ